VFLIAVLCWIISDAFRFTKGIQLPNLSYQLHMSEGLA